MKIPSDFILTPGKLAYLLRLRPKDDKSKYLLLAGFSVENSGLLETAIRDAAVSGEAELDRSNEFGSFYLLRASLTGPNGTQLDVKLIFHKRTDNSWSFVTLYPYKD